VHWVLAIKKRGKEASQLELSERRRHANQQLANGNKYFVYD